MNDSGEKNKSPSDDDSGNSRPNAKYRLSRETAGAPAGTPGGEEMVFYYNRERRLAKASQMVRDLYKEEKPRRFGIFRSLFSTKPRAMMAGSILIICAAIFMLSILGYTGGNYELDGNRLSIQALRYEGASLIVIKKKAGKSGFAFQSIPYTGAVDIACSPAGGERTDEQPAVFLHRIFFTLEELEDFRFTVPFDAEKLILVFQTAKKNLKLTIQPE